MQSRVIEVGGAGLHVAETGEGPAVVALSGGPGCVHYLEDEALAPDGFRAIYPEPRGVGRSGGGPHDMARAVADLEAIRLALGLEKWLVLGHSWGSELALRYAVDHPASVVGVVAIAGTGPQRDRSWAAAYEAGAASEPTLDIEMDREVWESLRASFAEWIHEPTLWRSLADCDVPIRLIAAELDIRPSWPLRQLAELMPSATFDVVTGVPHDFWSTHAEVWRATVTAACTDLASAGQGSGQK